MPPGDASFRNPQRAFVETFKLEDGAAGCDVRVEEDGDVRVVKEGLAVLAHVPYNVWQPVPQYALVLPLRMVS